LSSGAGCARGAVTARRAIGARRAQSSAPTAARHHTVARSARGRGDGQLAAGRPLTVCALWRTGRNAQGPHAAQSAHVAVAPDTRDRAHWKERNGSAPDQTRRGERWSKTDMPRAVGTGTCLPTSSCPPAALQLLEVELHAVASDDEDLPELDNKMGEEVVTGP